MKQDTADVTETTNTQKLRLYEDRDVYLTGESLRKILKMKFIEGLTMAMQERNSTIRSDIIFISFPTNLNFSALFYPTRRNLESSMRNLIMELIESVWTTTEATIYEVTKVGTFLNDIEVKINVRNSNPEAGVICAMLGPSIVFPNI